MDNEHAKAWAYYLALIDKTAAFSSSVSQRYPGAITCRAGCAACCSAQFSVTAIEAAAIRRQLAQLDEKTRERLRQRAQALQPGASCPALDAELRCEIYAARPVICRTHGLAIRYSDGGGKRNLPVLDACDLNFNEIALDDLDPQLVLDQRTLSTMLAAINRAFCGDAIGRESIGEILQF